MHSYTYSGMPAALELLKVRVIHHFFLQTLQSFISCSSCFIIAVTLLGKLALIYWQIRCHEIIPIHLFLLLLGMQEHQIILWPFAWPVIPPKGLTIYTVGRYRSIFDEIVQVVQ